MIRPAPVARFAVLAMIAASLVAAAPKKARKPRPRPAPVTDAIDAAAHGLNAVIEDDLDHGGDIPLTGVRTKACSTQLIGSKASQLRSWTIDWRTAEAVLPEDTFVFVKAPGLQFAIVGDASIPTQSEKLQALAAAMFERMTKCGGGKLPDEDTPPPPESSQSSH